MRVAAVAGSVRATFDIKGTPVAVVFLSTPVASPASEVPLSLVTVRAFVLFAEPSNVLPALVASPVTVQIVLAVARAVAVQAFQETVVWSPVFVPLDVPLNVPD